MAKFIAAALGLLIISPAFAAGPVFTRNLKMGDSGSDVLALQQLLNSDSDTAVALAGAGSVGQETSYFGPATRAAVVKFQNKYKKEILYPNGLVTGNGFVGISTRAKITGLLASGVKSQNATVTSNTSQPTGSNSQPPAQTTAQKPEILGVSPTKVRAGDMVTVTGRNFTATGNMVELGDGPVYRDFKDLPSADGKTITFVYEPPIINNMSPAQVENLPANLRDQLEKPVEAAGYKLSDLLTDPYPGIHNEDELRQALAKNGHSFDEMYHYFHVIVKNANGGGISKTALLHGLRDFPFEHLAEKQSGFSLVGAVKKLFAGLFPSVSAQSAGGGFNTGIVMVCTCNGNLMTFQTDLTGPGSGFWVYEPGYVPDSGSCLLPSFWLGMGYQPGTGNCQIYAGMTCISIVGTSPPSGYDMPYGCSL